MIEQHQLHQGPAATGRRLVWLCAILAAALFASQVGFGETAAPQTKKAAVTDPCQGIPQPTPDPATNALTVKITLDSSDNPVATPPTVCVDKAKDQQVKWVWAGPGTPDFDIFFAEKAAPFNKRHFSKGNPHSGKAKVPADPGKKYKYFVSVDGHGIIDPDVIIK